MKRTTIMKYTLAALLPMMAACQDEWDEHYGSTNPLANPESLWEAMKADANLSNFVQLAENTGYNYQFNGDQMFTVFAPTNDCLSQGDIDSLTAAYNEQKARKVKDNDNTVISYDNLKYLLSMYKENPQKFAKEILKTAPERIHTLIPGLTVLYGICRRCKQPDIHVSPYGIREGYLRMKMQEEMNKYEQ